MSNAVFPSLPGLAWPIGKTPMWKTPLQRAASGREVRIALQTYPLWRFTLSFNLLRSGTRAGQAYTEYQTLADFYLARQGSYDSFLFDDASDDSVTDMPFGTGDGNTAAFQLARTLKASGFAEPVMNLNGSVTNVKSNGNTVNPANYSVSSSGLVTFNSAPAANAALTWTGAYYYRARFEEDERDFEQFMNQLWQSGSVKLVACLGNKV